MFSKKKSGDVEISLQNTERGILQNMQKIITPKIVEGITNNYGSYTRFYLLEAIQELLLLTKQKIMKDTIFCRTIKILKYLCNFVIEAHKPSNFKVLQSLEKQVTRYCHSYSKGKDEILSQLSRKVCLFIEFLIRDAIDMLGRHQEKFYIVFPISNKGTCHDLRKKLITNFKGEISSGNLYSKAEQDKFSYRNSFYLYSFEYFFRAVNDCWEDMVFIQKPHRCHVQGRVVIGVYLPREFLLQSIQKFDNKGVLSNTENCSFENLYQKGYSNYLTGNRIIKKSDKEKLPVFLKEINNIENFCIVNMHEKGKVQYELNLDPICYYEFKREEIHFTRDVNGKKASFDINFLIHGATFV